MSSDKSEIFLSGRPASPGIVIGKTHLYQRQSPRVSLENINDGEVEQQLGQFKKVCVKAENELQQLLEEQDDEKASELINTQIEMINDPDLRKRVETEITENNQPADSAIQSVFEDYLNAMNQHQDKAFPDRSVDVIDIRNRLIQLLNNRPKKTKVEEGAVLVAKELSPREVIEFYEQGITGIIIERGGATSHAAIIARSMNIPMAVGLKKATALIASEKEVVLDGGSGEAFVNPQTSTRKKYQKLVEQQLKVKAELEAVCTNPNETADGHPFRLCANIEFIEELDAVKKYRAEGIGLLRTESIYLQREHFGDQEKQESFYETVLESTKPHPVTIRLFDAGGDKFFKMYQKEPNPFLGWRGIRMLLDEEPLLKNQLKAILKTAGRHQGRIRILVPMISALEEVLQIKKLMSAVQSELKNEGVAADEQVQLGIMVEVPSVALQAESFAEQVDFLSIGTNDLTQYMLAVDRGNELISGLYDQRHPAMWKIIKYVSDAAKKKDVPLNVCGELASDPVAACCLLGFGINELSMSPSVLPAAKKMLCNHSLKDMQQLGGDVLKSETMADINRIFNSWE